MHAPAPRVVLVHSANPSRERLGIVLARALSVVTASTNREALEAIQRGGVDLVLTEVSTSEIDGRRLLRTLRADPKTAGIPVVFLSTPGADGEPEGDGEAPDDYLEPQVTAGDSLRRVAERDLLARIALRLAATHRHGDLSAREQAEEALRESEERYRHLIAGLPAAVYVTDAEGRLQLYNEAAAELWGRAPEIGKDLWCGSYRIYHPDGRPMPLDECPMAVALREGRPVRGEEIIIERPDGTRRHVLPHPEPIFDSNGRLAGAINMLMDITPRKQAEKDRALLATIVESSDDAIISKTLDGVVTSWNEAAKRTFGYTAEEMVGQSITRLIPPERIDEEAEILKRLHAGERIEHFETVRVGKEGQPIDISLTISPLYDSSGRIMGASKIARDITARKRTLDALRESEDRLRMAFAAGQMGTWEWDIASGHITWSPSLEAIHGRALGSFDGTFESVIADIHPDDLEHFKSTVQKSLETGEQYHIEYRILTNGGTERWLEARGTILNDEHGRPQRMAGICMDVTRRKRAELALREREAALRFSHRAARAGTWTWEAATERVTWSPECYELFGVDPNTPLVYDLWRNALHPDDRDRADAAAREAMERGEELNVEYRIIHPERGERWLTSIGRIIDPVERPGYMTGISLDITDRKHAEDALQESQRQLSTLLANLPGAAYRCPTEKPWPLTFVSEGVARLTGRSAEEFMQGGLTWVDVMHPEDVGPVKEEVEAALREKRLFSLVYRIIHTSGDICWVLDRGQVLFDENREPVAFEGMLNDVTEQMRAQQALRESEVRFRAMANTAPAIIWTAAPDGTITWASDRWFEYTGISPEANAREWQGVPNPDASGLGCPPSVLHPDDKELCLAAWNEALRHGTEYEVEVRNRRHDGKYRWFLTRATPIRDARGTVIEWLGSTTDIHHAKQVEEALRASEERFRTLSMNAPVAIFIKDSEGRYTLANALACEALERPEGIVGLTDHEMMSREAADQLRKHDLEVLSTSRPLEREETVLVNGRRRDFLSAKFPMLDAQGRTVAVCGVAVEITERKKAQELLHKAKEELKRRVAERTRELEETHERLRFSERLASMGTLAAGLGHDMGNLLMPLRVRLDTLAKADLPPEMREHLEAIHASTDYLKRLASGLRMLAVDPEATMRKSISIHAWWNNAAPLLRTTLPGGVSLTAELPEEDCWIAISTTALTQIVFNLVQNAGDAMRIIGEPDRVDPADVRRTDTVRLAPRRGRGGVSLRVKPGATTVAVIVSDDGPGMPDEVKARCMEPFFTSKAAGRSPGATREGEPTGMGLVLVARLIREANGDVEVQSEPGCGTTFTITLPSAATSPVAPGDFSRKKGEAAREQKLGVAVVDLKDARVAAFARSELSKLGFEIVSGPCPEITPAVVVIDADMALAQEHCARGSSVVLLGEAGAMQESDLKVVGAMPTIEVLHRTLVEVAEKHRM